MATQDIAAALRRVHAVLQRRPETGLEDDSVATVRWNGGLRTIASHANGRQTATDVPVELGGGGDQVTPGWLLRAGVASCTATSIAIAAAAEGVELDMLEVRVSSRSHTCGMLGIAGADGTPVYAGPTDMRMDVKIAARGVPAQRLRTLVEEAQRRSPMARAVEDAVPVALHIDIDELEDAR
jgi:uncharacterized OsmC-like protein